jgi:hypothetical protein
MILDLEGKVDGAIVNLSQPPYSNQGLTLGILGNMGSGKSWTLAVLGEEVHRNKLPFIVYDVDGDSVSLRELGDDVIILGQTDHSEEIRRAHYDLTEAAQDAAGFVRLVLEEGFSLVIDLSNREQEVKHGIFRHFALTQYELGDIHRAPVLTVVDEAHEFAPQRRCNDMESESKEALKKLVRNGRKRGVLLAIATQRSTFLDKDVLFGMNIRLFGFCTWESDYKAQKSYLPREASFSDLQALESGEYYLVSQRRWGKIKIKQRKTTHLGGTPLIVPRGGPRPSIKSLEARQLAIPLEFNAPGE